MELKITIEDIIVSLVLGVAANLLTNYLKSKSDFLLPIFRSKSYYLVASAMFLLAVPILITLQVTLNFDAADKTCQRSNVIFGTPAALISISLMMFALSGEKFGDSTLENRVSSHRLRNSKFGWGTGYFLISKSLGASSNKHSFEIFGANS